MDPAVKNLRDWVALLFVLFLALDVAGVQYGMSLARTAPLEPNLALNQIQIMLTDLRGDSYNVYLSPLQLFGYYGLLTAAGLSLLATLSVIVGHGIHQLRINRPPAVAKRSRRASKAASESRRLPRS